MAWRNQTLNEHQTAKDARDAERRAIDAFRERCVELGTNFRAQLRQNKILVRGTAK
jgi:hypothetical protein